MSRKLNIIVALLSLILIHNQLKSQVYREQNYSLGSVNLGIGGSNFGMSYNISFSVINGSNIWSVRYLSNHENQGMFASKSPPLKIWDFSALYGKVARSDLFMASIEISVALVGYNERGEMISSGSFLGPSHYEEREYTTIGLPVQSQLMLTGKHVGVGVTAFALISEQKPVAGALFTLKFGRLRN